MKGIIYSIDGLLIGTVACFFVFALQGLAQATLILGICSLLGFTIRAILVSPVVKERTNAIYSPSRSRRIKNRKLRVA